MRIKWIGHKQNSKTNRIRIYGILIQDEHRYYSYGEYYTFHCYVDKSHFAMYKRYECRQRIDKLIKKQIEFGYIEIKNISSKLEEFREYVESWFTFEKLQNGN